MAKYKTGDVVKVTEGLRNGEVYVVADDNSSVPFLKDRNGIFCFAEQEGRLELATGWDRLVVGSEVKYSSDDDIRTVLAVVGRVVFLSGESDPDEYWEGYTYKDLDSMDYTFIDPNPSETQYAYDKDGKVLGELVNGKIIK